MSKKVIIVLVAVFLSMFIVFGILAAIGIGVYSRTERRTMDESYEYTDTQSVEIDNVKLIDIDVDTFDVIILNGGDKLQVELEVRSRNGREPYFKVDKNGNTIDIIVENEHNWINWGFNFNTRGTVYITLPVDYNNDIEIDGVSGDIQSRNKLENELKSLNITVVSAEIDFMCNSIDELMCDTVSGNVDVDANISDIVKINTVSGNVDIEKVLDGAEKVVIDTVSGDADILYEAPVTSKLDSISGTYYITFVNAQGIDLDFDSVSGDIRGDVDRVSTGVEFNVDTVSGDLKFQEN